MLRLCSVSTCAPKQAKRPEAMQHGKLFSHLFTALLGKSRNQLSNTEGDNFQVSVTDFSIVPFNGKKYAPAHCQNSKHTYLYMYKYVCAELFYSP